MKSFTTLPGVVSPLISNIAEPKPTHPAGILRDHYFQEKQRCCKQEIKFRIRLHQFNSAAKPEKDGAHSTEHNSIRNDVKEQITNLKVFS